MNSNQKKWSTSKQKLPKNPSKIVQKSSKNPPQIDQNRGLEGVWSDSGSQGRLGTQLGWPRCDFRGQDGPNLGPKMEPKSIKIDSKINQSFICFLRSICLWILFDSGSQNGAKLAPKSTKNRCQEAVHLGLQFLIGFDRFLVPTSTPRTSKIIVFPSEK